MLNQEVEKRLNKVFEHISLYSEAPKSQQMYFILSLVSIVLFIGTKLCCVVTDKRTQVPFNGPTKCLIILLLRVKLNF